MRSADLIVHYEVFYYGVAPHYEPHSYTSAREVRVNAENLPEVVEEPQEADQLGERQRAGHQRREFADGA